MIKNRNSEKRFDNCANTYENLLQENIGRYGKDTSYYSEYKIKLIQKNSISNPDKILDFGCGIGLNIPFLQDCFADSEITGCDISEKSIVLARENNPAAEFFILKEILTHHKQFDLILLTNVLHHVEPQHRNDVFQQIYSLLQPGGEVFIFEHNPLNPLTVHAVNTCPFDEGVVLLKPDEILNKAEKAGFNILKKKYCLFFPSALRMLSPVENLLNFIPFGGQYFIQLHKG